MTGLVLDGRRVSLQPAGDKKPNTPRVNNRPTNLNVSEKDIARVKSTGSLFVSNLAPETTDAELLKYFSSRGVVNDCRVFTNPKTSQSLGTAGIVFHDPEIAVLVLKQTRPHVIHNRSLRISAQAIPPETESKTIHIQHPVSVTKDDLSAVFNPFGEIVSLKLLGSNLHGFAVLQFESPESAQKALASCNGKDLPGIGKLIISLASDSVLPRSRQQHHPQSSGLAALDLSTQKEVVTFFNSQLELCIQQRPLSTTAQEVSRMTEQGAKLVGDHRARLLYVWYYLLQDSERPGANHGVDTRTKHVQTFRDIFAGTHALDHLVANSFDHPFSTPVSANTLPSACKLSVSELLLKIFSKVLMGPSTIHKDLLDVLEHLSFIRESATPHLRQQVGRLIACFQAGPGDTSKSSSQPMDLQKELALIDAQAPSQQIVSLQKKWQSMFKDSGMGGFADVAAVHQSIISELEKIKLENETSLDVHRTSLAQVERALTQVQIAIKDEIGVSGTESEMLEKRVEALREQKQTILNDLSMAVQQLEAAQNDQERLLKQKKNAHSKLQPKMSSYEAEKRATLKDIEAFEQRGQLFAKSKGLLDRAHVHISKRISETQAQRSVVPANLTAETVNVTNKYLIELLDKAKKTKARQDFLSRRIVTMKADQQEMISLELESAVPDLARGSEKLNRDIASATSELRDHAAEAERVVSWLHSLKKTNLARDTFQLGHTERVLGEIKKLAN